MTSWTRVSLLATMVVCERCAEVGRVKIDEPRSKQLEIVLWLLLLLPGAIYRLWRSYKATLSCPSCGGKSVALVNDETAGVWIRSLRTQGKLLGVSADAKHVDVVTKKLFGYFTKFGILAIAAESEQAAPESPWKVWFPFRHSKFESIGVHEAGTALEDAIVGGLFLGTFGALSGIAHGKRRLVVLRVRSGKDELIASIETHQAQTLLEKGFLRKKAW